MKNPEIVLKVGEPCKPRGRDMMKRLALGVLKKARDSWLCQKEAHSN